MKDNLVRYLKNWNVGEQNWSKTRWDRNRGVGGLTKCSIFIDLEVLFQAENNPDVRR